MDPSLASLGFAIEFGGVVQAARELGIDATALCERHADAAWSDRSRLWGAVMRAVRVDGFPIRVAQRISLGETGPLGTSVQVAPDLRSAFQRLIDYQHLFTGRALARMSDDVAPGNTVVEFLPIGDADLGWRCRREMLVANGLEFAREISGTRIRPRRVCFRHAKPSDSREHEEFFGCEVRFAAAYDGLDLGRDTLAMPLPGADPDLSQFLVEHLRAIAGDPPAAEATLEERVRQVICRRLGSRPLAMDALAQDLGMSTRTLRRRLIERQTSYNEILDRVRRELADKLLVDPDHKLSEVAFRLGFSDASALHRAYLRWTGTTPASRRRVRADPAA